MKRSIQLPAFLLLACILLSACQDFQPRTDPVVAPSSGQRLLFDGVYDNHEQVVRAKPAQLPQVLFKITPLKHAGWYFWDVQWANGTKLTATWVLRSAKSANGTLVLTPYRALVDNPATGADFNADQWIALDACALHGTATADQLQAQTDLASCATVTPGIGAAAAMLPLSIEHDGEWLRVRLYADQVRGPEARSDARQVRWFAGWAAINGAGKDATAESGDWHMNREIRAGSEGGRVAMNWRDGTPSGYSLELEHMTYRDGNVPVLKLSVIENASGRAIAYSWANPQATQIGINLGWIQIGLDAAASAPTP